MGLQVPALGIFEKSLEMGKFDKNRLLSDGTLMTFKKARARLHFPDLHRPCARHPSFTAPLRTGSRLARPPLAPSAPAEPHRRQARSASVQASPFYEAVASIPTRGSNATSGGACSWLYPGEMTLEP